MHKIIFYTNYNIGDIMFIYIIIFLSKIIENTLATLRIILVSNGKKKLGAILQGLVTLLWLIITGVVLIDINKNILKIVFFCLGCTFGSYLGSYIEEKLALGTNTIIAIIDDKYNDIIYNTLKNYQINTISIYNNKIIIMIVLPRKKTIYVNKIINKIDNKSIITNLRSKNHIKHSIY